MSKTARARKPAAPAARPVAAPGLVEQAMQKQAAGELDTAGALLRQALSQEPGNVAALYTMASIESARGAHESALEWINRALSGRPDFAQSYLSRSIILTRLGRLAAALDDAERALALNGGLQAAERQRALLVQAMAGGTVPGVRAPTGRPPDPNPNTARAAPVSEAVALARRQANAQVAAGMQLQEAGQPDAAAQAFQAALQLDPESFSALYSLGFYYSQRGDAEQTISYFERAVKARPQDARGWFALGTVLMGRALYEAALEAFDQAIQNDPKYVDAYNNKAVLLTHLRRTKDALETAEAGLAIDPDNPELLEKKGDFLTKASYQAAAAVFDRLRQIKPDFEYAEGRHAFSRMHCCDWTGYEENRQRIIEGVRAGRRMCMPLAFMAMSDDAYDARRCAEIFGAHRFPAAPEPLWRGERYRHRKTRVAFVSADFRMHPVGYLLIGMIESLDRQRFESIGVSLGVRDGSELYPRFRNAFDHYLDCHDKTAAEIARLMRAMEVDIAIDLSGYTAGSRIDILSHRPAPVQMGYLGFPGTLALPYVDYIIADRYTIPESMQAAYSEKVLYLPHCYLPRDTSVIPAPEGPPREQWGLPDEGVVFCSFNHDYKITPTMFDVWADLLRETPDSVLWLMKLNEDAERNLLAAARARDVDPKRLVFATRVPRIEDHLARLRHADVYLDTYPYNGHTTTSDVLLSGVDVVTLSGTSFASRVSGSLLTDFALGGSVSADLSQYRHRAMQLAASAESRRSERLETENIAARRWPVDSGQQGEGLGEVLGGVG